MMILQAILDSLNARKNRLLLVAQAALPESQFQAFRKLFLGELGKDGLEAELAKIVVEHENHRNR
ncbi:MAG: hypothetical protein WBM28_01965 [Burkholderiales bacterium]